MITPARREAAGAPEKVTVAAHELFRDHLRSLLTDDDLDDLDDLIEVDPGDFNPPSRKKDAELARTLAILDDIEMKGGKA